MNHTDPSGILATLAPAVVRAAALAALRWGLVALGVSAGLWVVFRGCYGR